MLFAQLNTAVLTAPAEPEGVVGSFNSPPLASLPGLGAAAAESLVGARNVRPFSSQEDLRVRGHVSKAIIDLLAQQGCLGDLPESDQLQLFG